MKYFSILFLLIISYSCQQKKESKIISLTSNQAIKKFEEKLSDAAISIIDPTIEYDPAYFSIPYPNGDVPKNKGVCTDVIIRSYRKLGIDLQKEVHENMIANFSAYPNLEKWGMTKTDPNIDHRRVPNLEVYFERKGQKLNISQDPSAYKTGEIVTWMINGKLPHIGIVTNKKSKDGKRNLIVHNVGGGQVLEDCLFNYEIVGHYKYVK
ncbi:DUF1287 domain-containing protein [Flavobacterium sp. Fl-318]|uniref:DUF1287 domain-containing protein n=1 Tax=Flavobacterium cupriresistens TaxID=2893885 RepID=A0ABU4RC84_9FLAO|nr:MULTISPECIES: DUF1287 domain-containing protein [unclassified Flavobacterium]MDX6190192.1 DUF1287 domain-containing protein [Flavobacterium sp. Fl-318]UFH43010.1 DUF1287 domain-containing protein [Flavobacterium sp. F-323]